MTTHGFMGTAGWDITSAPSAFPLKLGDGGGGKQPEMFDVPCFSSSYHTLSHPTIVPVGHGGSCQYLR